jgi:hypothetical protein
VQLCSASGPALRLAGGAFLVLIALMGSVFCATRTCRSGSADALLLGSTKKRPGAIGSHRDPAALAHAAKCYGITSSAVAKSVPGW